MVCGDGKITGNEACDDGNTADGDGCSAKCEVERAGPARRPASPAHAP